MSQKCESCGRFGATSGKFKFPDASGDPYTLYLCASCWTKTMAEWMTRSQGGKQTEAE